MLRFITIGFFQAGGARRGSRVPWRTAFRFSFATASTTPTSLGSDSTRVTTVTDSALRVLNVATSVSTTTATGGREVPAGGMGKIYCAVAQRLRVTPGCVRYVLEQADRGATVPFLARYRRDETGRLDESALRELIDTAAEMTEVERRRKFMLRSLRDRGLLTDTLRRSLESLVHLSQLEDAWEPFKERRASLAHRAREAGLAPLAARLLHTTDPIDAAPSDAEAARLLEALIVEQVLRCEDLRQSLLEECRRSTVIHSDVISSPRTRAARSMDPAAFDTLRKQFRHYNNRCWAIGRISAHQLLAIQRGESKGVVTVRLVSHATARAVFDAWAARRIAGTQRWQEKEAAANTGSAHAAKLLRGGLEAAYAQVIKATHATIRRDLKKSAETEAIAVFARGLRHTLLQCPMREARVLAMDPGFTHGVKCVALDENGGVLTRFMCTIRDQKNMKDYVSRCVAKLQLNKIVIGNGTASREVADIVADTIDERELCVEYAIVSEAGASVYSISDVAKEEFPTLDAMYRGAVSIGRRVIDPLSELVKIPVRSMGIGMYQHDVSETQLLRALHRVVESCVASVGVNVMSSNRYMMEKIPGVTRGLVDQIVLARHAGRLRSREDLRRIPGMTEAAYQQIAGFFRFPNSPNPLDNSNIHPESYSVVQRLLNVYAGQDRRAVGEELLRMSEANAATMATRVGCGRATLELVARELASPALDPRSELPHVGLFRRAPRRVEDLQPGDELVGAVRNVTPFGVFVDVGLHDDVLVRGVDVNRVHTGSVMDKLQYEGRDDLGRLLVRHTGSYAAQANRQYEGLAMESADVLMPSTTTEVEGPGDSEAWWLSHKGTDNATTGGTPGLLKKNATHGVPSAPEKKNATHGAPSASEKKNATHGAPSAPEKKNATHGVPSAPEKKNATHGAPSASEKKNATHGAPSAPEKKSVTHGVPSASEKKNATHGAPSASEKKNATHGAPSASEKKSVTHGVPSASEKKSVTHGVPSAPEKKNATHGAPSAPEKKNATHGAPSAPEKKNATHGVPSASEKKNATHGAPSASEKKNATHGAPSASEKKSVTHGVPSASEKKSVTHGVPSAPEKKNATHGAPSAPEKKNATHGAPSAPEKKNATHGAPSASEKKNATHGAPSAPEKKSVTHGAPSASEKKNATHGVPSAPEKKNATHGAPSASEKKNATHGAPSAPEKKSVTHGAPSASEKKSVTHGVPSASEKKSVTHGVPSASEKKNATHGAPSASEKKNATHGAPSVGQKKNTSIGGCPRDAGKCTGAVEFLDF